MDSKQGDSSNLKEYDPNLSQIGGGNPFLPPDKFEKEYMSKKAKVKQENDSRNKISL